MNEQLRHFRAAVEALPATKPLPRVRPVAVQVADIMDEEQFPEFAIARAYARGETPSPELIARADERALCDCPVGRDSGLVEINHG